MSKKPKKVPDFIDPRTVKVRHRYAPGVRVHKSKKEKENKHKKNFLSDEDSNSDD